MYYVIKYNQDTKWPGGIVDIKTGKYYNYVCETTLAENAVRYASINEAFRQCEYYNNRGYDHPTWYYEVEIIAK